MSSILLTAPAIEPVPLAEAKAYLRVEHNDDDELIGALISGSRVALSATSSFTASGLDAFEDGWFTAGKLRFSSGTNTGISVEVKSHRKDASVALDLWQAMPEPIAPGDTFTVTAGCDKRFQTCHERFDNVVNFRGFPHIPGNDFVIRYPVQGEPGHDGKSMQG